MLLAVAAPGACNPAPAPYPDKADRPNDNGFNPRSAAPS